MDGNLWRISVKPSDGSRAVDALTPSKYVMDWGGGLIWALLPEGADVRTRLKDIPGHATLLRGKGYAAFPPEAAGVAALSKGLRRQFDPKGLFRSDLSV
jgi:glycolate oxidase FAD binding subunit